MNAGLGSRILEKFCCSLVRRVLKTRVLLPLRLRGSTPTMVPKVEGHMQLTSRTLTRVRVGLHPEACPEGTAGLSPGFQPWEGATHETMRPERAQDRIGPRR